MAGSAHGSSIATGLLCRQMRHLTTVRGHRLAVYCCTYDNTGRRVITGSDDFLVKIWSSETGTLLKSCRGHDAEITDFAVNRDNTMLASGDVAHAIRVWSLQEGTLGWPVAVLNGHTNVVSYLDFHPYITDALLSCSTDGTCRIWNARDPGIAALVLRPGAVFGIATRHGPGASAEREAEEATEAGVHSIGGSLTGQLLPSRAGSADPVNEGPVAAANAGGGVGPTGSARTHQAFSDGAQPETAGGTFGSPQPMRQHEEAAPVSDTSQPPVGFLCCSWSPDGTFIFAGGTDCTVCVWHWDLGQMLPAAAAAMTVPTQLPPAKQPSQQSQPEQPPQQQVAGGRLYSNSSLPSASTSAAAVALGSTGLQAGHATAPATDSLLELFAGRDWTRPTELAKLSGHRNDIVFIEFSHEGTAVATASRDGCVKIWRLERNRRCGRLLNCWREAMSLACPPTEEEIRKARLKRKPPPHPAINQVAWNLDDSRMVAAVTDNSVRVWDTASGTSTHILLEHSAQAHVLEAHPQDPRLVMSGGYDGRTILWDVIAGVAIRMFSTQDTFPGRGRWTDPLQLVDGHFAPDGAQLAVTDTAGQLHLYGVPVAAASDVMARAPYDQFLGSDYNGLIRDMNGWVLDELTQQPPHLMTKQTLCDYSNHPYPIEIQAAFSAHRLSDLPRPDPVDRDHPLPPALLTHPPTLVSASWLAVENGASAAAIQQAMNRAYERHMQALAALSRPDDAVPRGYRRSSGARNGIAGVTGGAVGNRSGSEPPRRPPSGAAAASAAAAAANPAAAANIPRGVYLVVDDPNAPPPLFLHPEYDSDSSHRRSEPSSSSSGGDGGDDDDVYAVSFSDPCVSRDSDDSDDDDDDDDPVILVDSDDGRPVNGRRGSGARDGSSGPAGRGPGRGGRSAASQGDGPTLRRSSRRERAEAREQEQQERIRRSARLSGHKRRYDDGDDAPESYDTDDEQQLLDEQLQDEEYSDTVADEDEPDDDDSGDDDEVRRRQRRAAVRRQRERE
ncbi:hypothetical protein Vretimale_16295, partial [Volvox reticuliferus]